jgi:myo-inositol-1-phosphate synthase
MEQGLSGAIGGPSAYLFKTPPKQYSDAEALKMMQAFSGHGNNPE